MNPWGITERQEQVLDEMVNSGSMKVAAAKLNISTTTAGQIITRAKRTMKTRGEFGHLLAWHEWKLKQKWGIDG